MRLITSSFIIFNHRQDQHHHHVSYKSSSKPVHITFFSGGQVINPIQPIIGHNGRISIPPSSLTLLKNSDKDFFDDGISSSSNDESIENFEISSLQDGEELSDDILSQLEEGQPSELSIMKELLGINAFTYVLAALIAFFLGCNIIFGPGWLGQSMGLEGTGTFTQMSDSLPDTVDLSQPENLL